MKKVMILTMEQDRAAALSELQKLGVLHVRPVVAPRGADLDQAREKVEVLNRVIARLPKTTTAEPSGRDVRELAHDLAKLLDEQKTKQNQIEALKAEAFRIEPFGSFDPAAIQALADKGITLKLYRAPLKKTPDLPKGVSAEHLAVRKNDGYWALFAAQPFDWEGAEELRPPTASLDELYGTVAGLEEQIAAGERELSHSAGDRRALQKLLAHAEAAAKYEEVRAGMGREENIAYLEGFVPAQDVHKVHDASAAHGWGVVVNDPGPEDDAPVKLKPLRWAKPIQAIFEGINILPAYNEADVSGVFMVFFSLFFAMIVGDAGYGTIFLLLTLLLRKKLPQNASNLLMVTSICTILWGLLSGDVFGLSPEILAKAGLDKIQLPFLTNSRSAENLMGLCFLIGAAQITIGHAWNVWDLLREKRVKALEQLGWILTTWYMFLLADHMVLRGNMVSYIGSPAALVPFTGSAADYMVLIGIVLIVLFMMKPAEFKDGWFNMALLPLNLVNNFTDVVSYVRLYAVGAAGFAVANAFNTMIFGGTITWWWGIIGAVLVFFAHVLNILLAVMGVLVHAIRLNTLEFSNHKGITWSGTPYRPFAKPDAAA
ncbi:MAG: hypothetical protein LBN38_06370 [Verrucomicrobiota bacterium]|nr:hypothetical protein [Verrucomicrobiota bacterium]